MKMPMVWALVIASGVIAVVCGMFAVLVAPSLVQLQHTVPEVTYGVVLTTLVVVGKKGGYLIIFFGLMTMLVGLHGLIPGDGDDTCEDLCRDRFDHAD
jgi:hypothetical protein